MKAYGTKRFDKYTCRYGCCQQLKGVKKLNRRCKKAGRRKGRQEIRKQLRDK